MFYLKLISCDCFFIRFNLTLFINNIIKTKKKLNYFITICYNDIRNKIDLSIDRLTSSKPIVYIEQSNYNFLSNSNVQKIYHFIIS